MLSRAYSRRQFSAWTLLTDEQLQLKETAAQYVNENIKPHAQEWDRTNHIDTRKYLKELGEMGMLGITCPEEYGGSGLGYLEHCLVGEEMARASASLAVAMGSHSNLCMNQIIINGSEEQKQKYLPDLNIGNRLGALAMSDSQAGSDVFAMKLKGEKVEGGYKLNGTKMWISNGPCADTIIVYARTAEHKTMGITAFIVENTFPGFSQAQKLDKFGIRGADTGELVFDNVFVPDENILGPENGGAYVMMRGLNSERLLISSAPVGVMQAVLDEVMGYVTTRKQFGELIGNFQLIQAKMADMFTKINAARCYVYTNAIMLDKGEATNADCASACLFSADAATQMALEGMQIFGGNGYINDYPLGRFVRDAKIFEIFGGTQEIRKIIIARELMAQYK